MKIFVRYGPAPEDTADEVGALHSKFTGAVVLGLGHDDAAELASGSGALHTLAAETWGALSAEGHGHILIGACDALEQLPTPGGCAMEAAGAAPLPLLPRGYKPLFAVARARRPEGLPAEPGAPPTIDLAIDYSNSSGPGDPSVRPFIFGGAPPP